VPGKEWAGRGVQLSFYRANQPLLPGDTRPCPEMPGFFWCVCFFVGLQDGLEGTFNMSFHDLRPPPSIKMDCAGCFYGRQSRERSLGTGSWSGVLAHGHYGETRTRTKSHGPTRKGKMLAAPHAGLAALGFGLDGVSPYRLLDGWRGCLRTTTMRGNRSDLGTHGGGAGRVAGWFPA
jgi:hypothetical protein